MKIFVLAVLATWLAVESAQAFPATATVSPGYDRALAESRRARGAGQPYIVEPAPRYAKPRYHKRKYRR